MVTRIGGARRKSRSKFSKSIKERGKLNINHFLRKFDEGVKVALRANPAVQSGLYHPRFHGQIGTVIGNQGICYKVEIQDKNKLKTLLVHPVHLIPITAEA